MSASNHNPTTLSPTHFSFATTGGVRNNQRNARHMLVARTSQGGAGISFARAANMSARSLGFGGEIARRSRATHHTLFDGPCYNPQMPNSETSVASCGKHTRRVHATQGRATHTDPQLLFSAAAS